MLKSVVKIGTFYFVKCNFLPFTLTISYSINIMAKYFIFFLPQYFGGDIL